MFENGERRGMDMTEGPSKRLFCVDLLRGLDIFFLLVISYTLLHGGLFRVWPLKSVFAQVFWDHSLTAFAAPGNVPTGFGLQDFTQPLFIFVTGVSASLAFRKFVRADGGIDLAAFWTRLAKRTLMLWALGSVIRGAFEFKLFTGGQPSFVFYSDTLHTIAVAYFGASVALLVRRRGLRLALGLALIAAVAAVQATCGDYTRLGNASRVFEDWVYGKLGGRAKDFCYLLTTFTWAGMGILASLAGDVLKGGLKPWTKAKVLAGAGVAAFLFGLCLMPWIPAIRFIYTVSCVFATQGLALLLLAGLFVLTDIWQVRRGTGLFVLFGQCSLAAWMIVNFFGCSLYPAADLFVKGIPKLIGTAAYQPIFNSVVRVAILIWALYAWRRLRRKGVQ